MSGAAAQGSSQPDEARAAAYAVRPPPLAPGRVAGSPFVPGAPVWELVARCQKQWGYSDTEMAAWIGLDDHVAVRGWMARSTAERILRRLGKPRPAREGTAALARQLNLDEQAAAGAHRRALARFAVLQRLHAAGARLSDVAAELGVSTRTALRLADEAGLSFQVAAREREG